jgi:hypothetical protein
MRSILRLIQVFFSATYSRLPSACFLALVWQTKFQTHTKHAAFIWLAGASGAAVGWGIAPHDERLRVRFPVGSVEIFECPNPFVRI